MADRRAAVSVVIPCYCCSQTLGRSLESVAKQIQLPLEVILVDDASPDGGKTQLAIQECVDRYQGTLNLKVITLSVNQGVAGARNAGWAVAGGDYIAFLDADDTWHPQKLEIQYGFMSEHPEVTFSGHRHVLESSEFSAVTGQLRHVEIGFWRLVLKNPCITPSVMVRRDVPVRFSVGKRYMEDHLLWMTLGATGGFTLLQTNLAKIHKAPFGESGLSSHLWQMEVGELENYWSLRRLGDVNLALALLLSIFSMAKFARRILMLVVRRLRNALD